MSKLTDNVKTTVTTTKNVVMNAEEFVLAASLVIVSVYNAYDLSIRPVGNIEFYVRAIASVVIGLKGATAVIKFFDKNK